MGNTPAHHKRRFSGESDCRSFGPSSYLNVVIPPLKRRNLHSFSDLSKSAPADFPDAPSSAEHPTGAISITGGDAVDEATSMMRAASIRESGRQVRVMVPEKLSDPDCSRAGVEVATRKPRHASTGPSSPHSGQRTHPLGNGSGRPLTHKKDVSGESGEKAKYPTVFRWNGGGREIYISGTFNNWEKRVPMVKRPSGIYAIIDCTPGMHEYKYFIDGAWYHDPTKPTVDNDLGTKNNVVQVEASDFDVIQALEVDQANSRHTPNPMETFEAELLGHSPTGEYGRFIPTIPADLRPAGGSLTNRLSAPIAPGIGTVNQPPLLPPHLLQGILNMDTNVHCDPSLLPPPNHVIVNHLYALSIKDGVVVLSVITRYRQKFVSTVFYKPIQD